MKRRLVSLTIYWLVLGPGTLASSAGTAAAVERNKPWPATADSMPESPPPALEPARSAGEIHSQAGAPSLAPEPALGPGGTAQLQDNGPSVSVPCLRGFFNADPLSGETAETECAGPSNGRQRFKVSFGSRIGTRSGIFGDVDGIRVDYRLAGGLTLKGIAGYPALSAKDKFNASRRVFGISADTAKFARAWDVNSYMIEQHDNGRTASRAVGGAIRYLQPKRSLLFYLDYDVVEKSLNGFMASSAWKLPYNTQFSATIDVRNSPIQNRQKKYLQRSMASAEGWKWILPSDRIKHFTKDGAREVSTLALGLSHAFSKRIKLSGDLAVLDVSSDGEAAGSASQQSKEYFYHLKLSGKNLMISGDSNIIDFRHRVTDSSRISSTSLKTRYDINRYWKISPRFSTDYRRNTLDNSVRWLSSPAVKMEYRWKKQYGFQVELGAKWSNQEIFNADTSRSSYFLGVGYQAKF